MYATVRPDVTLELSIDLDDLAKQLGAKQVAQMAGSYLTESQIKDLADEHLSDDDLKDLAEGRGFKVSDEDDEDAIVIEPADLEDLHGIVSRLWDSVPVAKRREDDRMHLEVLMGRILAEKTRPALPFKKEDAVVVQLPAAARDTIKSIVRTRKRA